MELDLETLPRALRRHHALRLKKARRVYWGHARKLEDLRYIGKVLSCPAPCSCFGCGNPRKWENLRTIQERRAMQALDELPHDELEVRRAEERAA